MSSYGNNSLLASALPTPVITITIQPDDRTASLDACYPANAPNDPVVLSTPQTALFSLASIASIGQQTYQWQKSSDNGISWTNITVGRVYQTSVSPGPPWQGINAALWLYSRATDTGVADFLNGEQYRAIITSLLNPAVSVVSNAATLTVPVPTLTITEQPANTYSSNNSGAGFRVAAAKNFTGSGWMNGFSYQWYRSDDDGATWTAWMTGSTYYQPTLQLPGWTLTTADNGSKWRCLVSSYIFCGGEQVYKSALSNAATLTVI